MKVARLFLILPLLVLFVFLSGCSVLNKYELKSSSFDLSIFEKEGLFVSTGEIQQKYISKSILFVDCYNGFIPKSKIARKTTTRTSDKSVDELYSNESSAYENRGNFEYKLCSMEDIFSEIIKQAKLIGADGIIKLEIKNVVRSGSNGYQNGIEVTGLAVKFK